MRIKTRARIKGNLPINIAATFLNVFILLWVDSSSVLSYFYTLIVFYIINLFFVKRDKVATKNILVLQFYVFLAISLYLIQLFSIPDYYGLSGPSDGIGTDDYRFLAMVSDNPKLIDLYPIGHIEPFAYFLKIIYPFSIWTPLNIIIPNLLGLAFIPYLTYILCKQLFNNEQMAKKSFLLMLICPFTLSNSLILMREGWVTLCFICAVICFLKRKYIWFILSFSLMFYLRAGSSVLLVLAVIVFSRRLIYQSFSKKFAGVIYTLLLVFFLLILAISVQYLPLIFGDKFTGSLFRDDFVQSFLANDEGSILYIISMLPIYLRIPLAAIFFVLAPYFTGVFYTMGVFNMRMVMAGILFPIYFLFNAKSFFLSLIKGIKSSHPLFELVILFIISCAFLGLSSLQIRHKITVMPLLYILIAYSGVFKGRPFNNLLAYVFTFFLFLIQLYTLL